VKEQGKNYALDDSIYMKFLEKVKPTKEDELFPWSNDGKSLN
jgi:hypothetical protein